MKRSLITVACVLALAPALLVGCGGQDGGGGQKTFLAWTTATSGGSAYQEAASASAVLADNSQTVSVDPRPSAGSVENIRSLREGQAELGHTTTDVASFAYEGERMFDEPYPGLRAVMAAPALFAHIVAPADSDIRAVQDLEGATIAVGPTGSSSQIVGERILESLGVSQYDPTPLGTSEAATAVGDGTVDAMLAVGGRPIPAVSELATTTDVRFISLSQEQLDQVQEDFSVYVPGEIEAGTYPGQDEAVPGVEVPLIIATDQSVSEDAIYEFLRVLVRDNHDEWVANLEGARGFSVENMQGLLREEALPIPLHPGAKRFFEEEGLTIPEELSPERTVVESTNSS